MSILAISSQVVRGHVGNAAAVPVLNAMGHEVWAVPTVLLSHHPGHGRPAGRATGAADIQALIDSLDARGWLGEVDAVITGYFAGPDQVETAAGIVAHLAAANPELAVMVDPIIGDDGRIYVSAGVPEAIRDRLLPRATMATPNLFELEWLAGTAARAPEETARTLGPAEVIVTSVPGETPDAIATLAVTAAATARHETQRLARVPNGCGDTLAAAYLGARLKGTSPEAALAFAGAGVAALARAAAETGADELPLIGMRNVFAD